jgi:hypothetical protein
MKAYDDFYDKRRNIFKSRGCPKLDSQFSENIAADKVGFVLDHKNGLDGTDSNGNTYEVKGTGYTNTKVRFSKNQADHVIWVKATQHTVFIYEMDNNIYSNLDQNGFVDMSKQKTIKNIYTLKF